MSLGVVFFDTKSLWIVPHLCYKSAVFIGTYGLRHWDRCCESRRRQIWPRNFFLTVQRKLRRDITLLSCFIHRTFHKFLLASHATGWHNCTAPELQLESSLFEFRDLNCCPKMCVIFLQPNEANFGSVVSVLLGSLLRISPHHYVSFHAINTLFFFREVLALWTN